MCWKPREYDRRLRPSADTGKNALSSLLGGSTFTSLAKTIGRFAGVGEGVTGSLLGMSLHSYWGSSDAKLVPE